MQEEIIVGTVTFGIFLVGYFIYKNLNKSSSGLDEYYKEILTSEEYKVKGQFEE